MKTIMGWFLAFISVFYLVGFGILGYGVWAAWRSTQASAWPTTPAKFTQLEVSENFNRNGAVYEVKVRYTYVVDGVDYEGSRLAFGYMASSGRGAHEEIHRKLKDAKAVFARYDPASPATSCLSFGIHRSVQIILAFALTWLLFVVGFTVLFWLFSRPDTVLLDNLMLR